MGGRVLHYQALRRCRVGVELRASGVHVERDLVVFARDLDKVARGLCRRVADHQRAAGDRVGVESRLPGVDAKSGLVGGACNLDELAARLRGRVQHLHAGCAVGERVVGVEDDAAGVDVQRNLAGVAAHLGQVAARLGHARRHGQRAARLTVGREGGASADDERVVHGDVRHVAADAGGRRAAGGGAGHRWRPRGDGRCNRDKGVRCPCSPETFRVTLVLKRARASYGGKGGGTAATN